MHMLISGSAAWLVPTALLGEDDWCAGMFSALGDFVLDWDLQVDGGRALHIWDQHRW